MNNLELKANKRKKQDKFIKKIQKTAFVAGTTAIIALCSTMTAFATPPQNTDTTTMYTLIGIVMWVVRLAILFLGCVPAGIRIVQGQQDGDVRERNGGIATIAIAAVVIAATFAIEPLFKSI